MGRGEHSAKREGRGPSEASPDGHSESGEGTSGNPSGASESGSLIDGLQGVSEAEGEDTGGLSDTPVEGQERGSEDSSDLQADPTNPRLWQVIDGKLVFNRNPTWEPDEKLKAHRARLKRSRHRKGQAKRQKFGKVNLKRRAENRKRDDRAAQRRGIVHLVAGERKFRKDHPNVGIQQRQKIIVLRAPSEELGQEIHISYGPATKDALLILQEKPMFRDVKVNDLQILCTFLVGSAALAKEVRSLIRKYAKTAKTRRGKNSNWYRRKSSLIQDLMHSLQNKGLLDFTEATTQWNA